MFRIPFLLFLLVGLLPPMSAHASPPQPGSYYLALGDSLAEGDTAAGVPPDPQCQFPTAPGYVCVFYRYLQKINPSIQLDNLGKGGVDSCVLIHGFGNGSPCTDPLLSSPQPSELDAAVQLLNANPGLVSPITVDVGGDDLLALLKLYLTNPSAAVSQLPATLTAYRANLDTILSTLRGAAPTAEIILCTQYNPLGGIPSPPLPSQIVQLEKTALDNGINQIMRDEAAKYNVVVADVAAAFNAFPGGAAALTYVPSTLLSGDPNKINIHPTAVGYRVYAQAVIQASGYAAPGVKPLTVAAHLGAKRVAAGKRETVIGTTQAGAAVVIKVHLPGRATRTMGVSVGASGAFRKTFKVGRTRGKGWVVACATAQTLQPVCTKKMTFQVTKKGRGGS